MSELFPIDEPLPHEIQRAAMGRPDDVTVEVASSLQLRMYLDAINDNGLNDRLAGVDAFGTPFIAFLEGCDGSGVAGVLVGSPWDGERDYPAGTYCEECSGANPLTLPHLSYPVRVLTRTIAGRQVGGAR